MAGSLTKVSPFRLAAIARMQAAIGNQLGQARQPGRKHVERVAQGGRVDVELGDAGAVARDAEELNVHGE